MWFTGELQTVQMAPGAGLAGLGKMKAGMAAALANQARALSALELLAAVGRATKQEANRWTFMTSAGPATITPWGMDTPIFESVMREESLVRSQYIPALLSEARTYGIGVSDDISVYPAAQLLEFYRKVLQMRQALITDAAQYGLGPNPSLPEPDRYIRLAEAVMAARSAKAAPAPAPVPAPVPAPPPSSIAEPAQPPPELTQVGPARVVSFREPQLEEYIRAESEAPVARQPPAILAPAARKSWLESPAIVFGGILLLFGGVYVVLRASR